MKYNNIYYPSKDKSFSKIPLSNIATGFDYGIGASAVPFDGEHKYIRITDIDENNGLYKKGKVVSPEFGTEEKYRVKENDILVARTGASVGKKYIYNKKDGKVYFAGFLIRLNITSVDSKYVFYSMSTNYYKEFITVMSQRSGQPGINAKELAKFKVNCPTDLRLARKYGALLTSIDNLIIKIKQSLNFLNMALIKYKLEIFESDNIIFETKKLGECCLLKTGYTPPTNDEKNFNGEYVWFSVADLKKKYVSNSSIKLSEHAFKKNKYIKKNTLLMSFKLTVGRLSITMVDCFTNEAIVNFTFEDGILDEYMYYMLSTVDIKSYGSQAAQGITLNAESLKKIQIKITDVDTQNKIANVLSSMDKLIEIEEKKLNQLELMKRYYLQQIFE